MLQELKVSNFAIIENIQLEFRAGLNILSGETGAGKSILLKSLGLLMGEKATSDSVRSGAESAVIEGSFDISQRPDLQARLHEMGVEIEDNQMIVRRIVAANNKGKVYINGALSALADLRNLVSPLIEVAGRTVPLIEMTGQHENRNLTSRTYQLDIIDQSSGLWDQRCEFGELFTRRQSLVQQIEELKTAAQNRQQRLDFLRYQRDEIRAANLKPGEEVEIEASALRLKNSSKLAEFVHQAENLLYGEDDSVASRLHFILHRASELKNADATLGSMVEPIAQAKTLITESTFDLRNYLKSLDSDPNQLEELEERLSKLRQLQKKFGNSAEDILAASAKVENEIYELENADHLVEELEAKLKSENLKLNTLAEQLHTKRSRAADQLTKRVNEQLADLNMKGLIFTVDCTIAAELSSTGKSDIEFQIQASKVDSPRSLGKFASGGELSRILLSIKSVAGAEGLPRTYLFDEVDTGVSGETAEKVGRKLKNIAKMQQVICVTHLPQVAAFASTHFFIQKSASGSKSKPAVQMEVLEITGSKRVEEIARLISGEKISKTSVAHAQALLSECAQR